MICSFNSCTCHTLHWSSGHGHNRNRYTLLIGSYKAQGTYTARLVNNLTQIKNRIGGKPVNCVTLCEWSRYSHMLCRLQQAAHSTPGCWWIPMDATSVILQSTVQYVKKVYVCFFLNGFDVCFPLSAAYVRAGTPMRDKWGDLTRQWEIIITLFGRHNVHSHVWYDVNIVIKRTKIDNVSYVMMGGVVGDATLANYCREKLSSC